ncbi:hypothetical protein D3C71_1708680 [compost metagenome]
MHHALGNTLAVKTLELLDQLHVLQQYRAIGSGGLRVLVVANHCAIVTGQLKGLGREGKRAAGKNAQQPLRGKNTEASVGCHSRLLGCGRKDAAVDPRSFVGKVLAFLLC